jgi:hypothetical protein
MDVCPPDSEAKEPAHKLEKGELQSKNEADSVSTGGAKYTLRKIRSLKKALADNSLRAEIEEVLGEDIHTPKSHENGLASSLENNPQMEMDTQEDNDSAGGRDSEKTQMALDSPVIFHENNTKAGTTKVVNPQHPQTQTQNISFKDACTKKRKPTRLHGGIYKKNPCQSLYDVRRRTARQTA